MIFNKKISPTEKARFQDALEKLDDGFRPIVAIRYERLDPSTRRPGLDYVEVPGVDDDIHIGFIVGKKLSKAKNTTILLRDLMRADGRSAGETNLRVDRVTAFSLLCYPPGKQRP